MDADGRLLRTWRAAAEDLGIEVEQHGDAVLVRQFGSPMGMLCSMSRDVAALEREAKELGMGSSALRESYLSYDRALVVATLNDWGWFGTGDPPRWYTGEPWSA
jgi:hypothetical protein